MDAIQYGLRICAPKRPGRHDESVVAKHMTMIRERVRAHVDPTGAMDAVEFEDAMREVQTAMTFDADGFRIAQSLENSTFELAQLMDHLASDRHDAHDEAVKAWVAAYKIAPARALGDRVRATVNGKHVQGVVARIDADRGVYLVRCADFGHVEKGPGSHGFLLPYEDVEPIPATE
jgi:hypothetical protein